MTLSLGRRHAYEKGTLLQTMRLPLGDRAYEDPESQCRGQVLDETGSL